VPDSEAIARARATLIRQRSNNCRSFDNQRHCFDGGLELLQQLNVVRDVMSGLQPEPTPSRLRWRRKRRNVATAAIAAQVIAAYAVQRPLGSPAFGALM
jgi:hypothetical protein